MRKMVAERTFPYRGRNLVPGQEFDCEDEHVATFIKIGHAKLKPREKQRYKTRVMTAENG